MISTGNQELDRHIGGYNNELVMIYGPGGSGKTTLALIALLGQSMAKKRTIFIDTDNRFSVTRFKQLCSNEGIFDSIFLLKANSFKEQFRIIRRLGMLVKDANASLVVVDTIGNHYRIALQDNYAYANKLLSLQLSCLSQIAREQDATVLLTNQVYSIDSNIQAVGGNMMHNWSKMVIELKKNGFRELTVRKPYLKSIRFRIKQEGIEILK